MSLSFFISEESAAEDEVRVGVFGGGVGSSPHVQDHLFSSVCEDPSMKSVRCLSTSYSVSDLIGVGGLELDGLKGYW